MINCKYCKADCVNRGGNYPLLWCRGYIQMTNADRIRAMSDEELAEFLSRLAYTGKEPWSEPFAKLFCDHCPEPEYTLDDGRKLHLHECDFKDGTCPHGSDIVWWLKQPAEGKL